MGRLRTPEPGIGACARQAGAVDAKRALSPRDALIEEVLGLGSGQWIEAGGLDLGSDSFAPSMALAQAGGSRARASGSVLMPARDIPDVGRLAMVADQYRPEAAR